MKRNRVAFSWVIGLLVGFTSCASNVRVRVANDTDGVLPLVKIGALDFGSLTQGQRSPYQDIALGDHVVTSGGARYGFISFQTTDYGDLSSHLMTLVVSNEKKLYLTEDSRGY